MASLNAVLCTRTIKSNNMRNVKIFVAVIFLGLSQISKAQEIPIIQDLETPIIKPLRLGGPRVGFTIAPNIDQQTFDSRYSDTTFQIDPFISQFGWQFEWQYFETRGGSAGLFEVIPLIGGLDQGLVLPSLNLLTGYRSKDGFEIGAGPNLNFTNSGFTLAVGYAFKSDHMNFPVNVAFTKSKDQVRMTIMFGFTKRRS